MRSRSAELSFVSAGLNLAPQQGNVMHTPDMIDEQAKLIPDANDKLQEGAITEDDKEEAGRPKRNRKPNIKVHGPEWTA